MVASTATLAFVGRWRPPADIRAPELVKMINRGALDITNRALQTCEQVFRYAIAHSLAT
jgi:hypothetical protein